MLYELLYPLREYFFVFNVFQYLTFRAAGAIITSLLISFFIGPKIIRTLKNRQIGEKIYNGPESHQQKEGTPTMGGIILLLSIILPSILWCRLDNPYIQLILFVTIFMGFIGFIDDYLKVIK
jgi:phospho-N-acetylmuramoyl-pentapeptide-transferase